MDIFQQLWSYKKKIWFWFWKTLIANPPRQNSSNQKSIELKVLVMAIGQPQWNLKCNIYMIFKKRENRPTLTPMPPPVLPAWPPHLQGGHQTRWRDNDHNDNMDTLVRHWNIIWDILRCIYILCTVWCNQMGTFFAEMSYWKASKCHAGMKTVF